MEKKNIPIFKLTIDDEDSGVDYVALVDHPAIERNWVAFSKSKASFQVSDQEKRIIAGPLMIANLPIYRNDPQMGEYYAMFDPETIYKIALRYFKNKFTSNVNIMHDPGQVVENVFMFQSFIIDRPNGIKPPKGFEGITDGSWFGFYKVENDEVWNEFVKSGELKGFSVEGIFKHEPYTEKSIDTIDNIIQVINEIAAN
jgi:hypothetical protein